MPNSKKTSMTLKPRLLTKEEIRRYKSQLHQRFDRLVVQQCAVRRFQLEHKATHQALCRLRHVVIDQLCNTRVGPPAFPLNYSLSDALARTLELFESRQGRRTIRTRDVRRALEIVGVHPLTNLTPSYTEAGFVENLLSILVDHLDAVEAAQNDLNFFDYFTLHGMTTTFDGLTAFSVFTTAQRGGTPLSPAYEYMKENGNAKLADLDVGYNRWFHLDVEPDDLDLACALALSSRPRTFKSLSIKVLDSAANPQLQEPGSGARALHLVIDLDRAPIDIDHAIGYLSKALKELLLEEHGFWANVPGHEAYGHTHFAHASDPPPMLREMDQFRGMLLGLWCWDLVRISSKKKARAFDEIREAIDHESSEELPTYLRRVESFISPPADKKSELDIAVTHAAVRRLGHRACET
jgi:hypothetical protein